jgi:hypothetical protein
MGYLIAGSSADYALCLSIAGLRSNSPTGGALTIGVLAGHNPSCLVFWS